MSEEVDKLFKVLRAQACNKKEYDKAKSFFDEFGQAYIDHNTGKFNRDFNLFLIGRLDTPVELDDKCKRCGECCNLPDKDGNPTDIKCGLCKYDTETGLWECAIYNAPFRYKVFLDEHGVVPKADVDIEIHSRCVPRRWQKNKIEGCPYNDKLEGLL